MQRTDRTLLTLLLSISFIGQASISMLNLALVFFVRYTLQASPSLVGIFASTASVTYCISLLGLKRFRSQIKPLHAVIGSTTVLAVIPVIIVLTRQLPLAFMLYGLYGVGMSVFWPPVMGWLSRGREQHDLGRRMGQFNVSWSIGMILGPYAAGLLSELAPRFALLSAAGLALVITLLTAYSALVLPDIRKVPSRSTLNAQGPQTDESTPLRYLCWIGLFTGYFIFGITMNIFPMFAQERLGFPEGTIGFMLLIRGSATTASFFLLGRSAWWHHRSSAMIGVQTAALLVCLFGSLLQGRLDTVLFMVLFGICFAHIYSFAIFHGVSGSIDREHRMALHEAVLTAGVFGGSSLGGMLFDLLTFRYTMLLAAAVAAVGLLGQLVVRRAVSR